MKIAKKFVAVMQECSHIAKNGTNDFHKYKYATAADVLEKAKSRDKQPRPFALFYSVLLFYCLVLL